MNATNYSLTTELYGQELRYFFKSTGKADIIKGISYRPMSTISGRPLYNLGFGNYISNEVPFDDTAINNNGDEWKVLKTVLSTVPLFFSANPQAVIYVCGSDSGQNFTTTCRSTCTNTRKCQGSCRKEGQRIGLYRWYIDRNFSTLSSQYHFVGGFNATRDKLEVYAPGKKYDFVLVYQR